MQKIMWYILLLLLLPYGAFADILFLKNGTVFEHVKIISASSTTFVVLVNSKEQNFDHSTVLRVKYNQDKLEKIYILLNNKTIIEGYIIEQEIDKVLIRRNKQNLREETILKEEIKQQSNKKFVLWHQELQLRFALLQTFNSGGADLGLAPMVIAAYTLQPPWLKNSRLGIEAGFAKSQSKNNNSQSLSYLPVTFNYYYPLQFNNNAASDSSLKNLSLVPHLGLGASYLYFNNGENETTSGVLPSVVAGVGLNYALIPGTLTASLFADYYMLIGNSILVHSAVFSIGLHYKL